MESNQVIPPDRTKAWRSGGYISSIFMKIVHLYPSMLVARILKHMKYQIEHRPVLRKFFITVLNNFPTIKLSISKTLVFEKRKYIYEVEGLDVNKSLRYRRTEKIVSHLLDELRNHK